MSESEASSYEQERRDKLQRLRDLGVDPYGQRTANVRALADVKREHKPEMGQDGGPEVTIAGRVMFARRIGKLTFLKLRDETEDLQVAIDKKRVSDLDWQVHDLIDLGDQIVVNGKLGQTKTGEPTVWATSLTFAAKALMPPPGKWHGLEDVELRYRQRYVDLWANPEVMKLAKLRTRVIGEMRSYLTGLGYTEVETPMMQIQHGGAAARPFKTHHNALDIPLYMRIAPELFLKRLLVGGFSKVFEINRNFRNEGISPRHNPEFTMLEAYEAYGSWETMADMVEGLVTHVAEKVFGTLQIEHKNETGEVTRRINLSRPWRRVRVTELVEERTGLKFKKDALSNEQIEQLRRQNPGKDLKLNGSPAEQLFEVYEKLIEPTLVDPTFVTHMPSVIIPLAKPSKDDPFFADVYELAINGVEISPGYTELNDPDVQEKQFAHQVGDKEEQQKVDEDFLNALRYGMPPAGGMGLGVDRLLMMLSGAESIRDVILFPLMKPHV
ncbi:MAG: lysyl-tRNA synthetase, class [Phycisphaerales bacterium]|jgi:lysyl-tRNA synthetase class 2|nr:lysyl-tRNA synthetase, class [Phycisphaerales bacterium]